MSKSMKLSAFYEKPELLMKLFGWVSAGVMLFNMVLICCDVFMRYAFNSPIQGTTEIVTMLMAWVAYAGMGYTLLKGQHMQLGAVYDRLHGRIKHIFSFFIYLLATILFVVMIKASWDQFWASWLIKEKSVAAVTVLCIHRKVRLFPGLAAAGHSGCVHDGILRRRNRQAKPGGPHPDQIRAPLRG